jgi:hypothetical protein
MPPTKTDRTPAIVEIERLGFKWTEIAQYDLTQLSDERRVQVRDSKEYAPREEVERYAIQMELAEFPPIIVTADAYLVDGNTRLAALRKRNQLRFPAIVLDVAHADSSQKVRDELAMLALTLNQANGRSVSKAALRRDIIAGLRLGWTIKQIGRASGAKPSVVIGIQHEEEARAKLTRVGIHPNGELKGASLRALGTAPVLALNDEPYKNLALFAADAGLNVREIQTAAKEIKETGSDAAGLAAIQQMRLEQAERIRSHELTGVGHPPVARQMRQRLGFVQKFRGQERELVETNPANVAMHLQALDEAIAVLQQAREYQYGR